MNEVRVPKLNANDVTYTLVEWLVAEGQRVDAGEPVAVVETSKAAEELVSESAGFVEIVTPLRNECEVGQVIARLHAAAGPWQLPVADTVADRSAGPAVMITAAARALIAQHHLDEARVRALGRRVIRREDIESLLASAPAGSAPAESTPVQSVPMQSVPAQSVPAQSVPAEFVPTRERTGSPPAGPEPATTRTLSRGQRAVAAVVTESHRSVPAAFVALKVRVGPALTLARDLSRRHRCLIGLPELVVKAVAAQHADFPLCFATPLGPDAVTLAEAAHVGVTIDVGGGLQVPVVHDTMPRQWRNLGRTLMGFRVTAMRGTFRPAQLAGGNIVVALHTDEDVTFAVPLVFPGQVCAVSLSATQTELSLAPDGAVVPEQVVQLGLAYDHRIINGGDAVAFLQAVKRLLNSPEQLARCGEIDTGLGKAAEWRS